MNTCKIITGGTGGNEHGIELGVVFLEPFVESSIEVFIGVCIAEDTKTTLEDVTILINEEGVHTLGVVTVAGHHIIDTADILTLGSSNRDNALLGGLLFRCDPDDRTNLLQVFLGRLHILVGVPDVLGDTEVNLVTEQ